MGCGASSPAAHLKYDAPPEAEPAPESVPTVQLREAKPTARGPAADPLFLSHLGTSVSSIETDGSIADDEERLLTMAMVDTAVAASREEDSDDRGPTGGRVTTPSMTPASLMQKLAAGERLSSSEEHQLERATSRRCRHTETPLSRQASFNKKHQGGQQYVHVSRRSSEEQRQDLSAALCAMSSARHQRQKQHEHQLTSAAAAAAAAVAAATAAAIAAVVALGDTADLDAQQCERESGAAEAFGDCVDALRRSSDALSRGTMQLANFKVATTAMGYSGGHQDEREPSVVKPVRAAPPAPPPRSQVSPSANEPVVLRPPRKSSLAGSLSTRRAARSQSVVATPSSGEASVGPWVGRRRARSHAAPAGSSLLAFANPLEAIAGMLSRRCSIDDTAVRPTPAAEAAPVAQRTRVSPSLNEAGNSLGGAGGDHGRDGLARHVEWEHRLEAMRQELRIDGEAWAELRHVMDSKPGLGAQ